MIGRSNGSDDLSPDVCRTSQTGHKRGMGRPARGGTCSPSSWVTESSLSVSQAPQTVPRYCQGMPTTRGSSTKPHPQEAPAFTTSSASDSARSAYAVQCTQLLALPSAQTSVPARTLRTSRVARMTWSSLAALALQRSQIKPSLRPFDPLILLISVVYSTGLKKKLQAPQNHKQLLSRA